MTVIPIQVGTLGAILKGLKKKKKTGGNGNQKKNQDDTDNSIVKIG